ncbi:hypothetical protein ACLOJK_016149 [Asimina triloba]
MAPSQSHNVHWRSVPLDGLSPGIVRDELGEMRIQDKKTGEREAAMGEDCNRGLPASNGCEWRWEEKKRGERKRPQKKERQDDNADKRGRILRNEGIKKERDLEKARSTKSNVDGAGRGDRDDRRRDDTNRRRGRKGAAKHEVRRRGRRGEEEPTVGEDDDGESTLQLRLVGLRFP